LTIENLPTGFASSLAITGGHTPTQLGRLSTSGSTKPPG